MFTHVVEAKRPEWIFVLKQKSMLNSKIKIRYTTWQYANEHPRHDPF